MKYMLIVSIVTFAFGFSPINEESFNRHCNLLYVQMMEDGEQSDKVNVYYDDLTSIFGKYQTEEIYQELENMYKALGNKGTSATPHQLKVMKLLNDQ